MVTEPAGAQPTWAAALPQAPAEQAPTMGRKGAVKAPARQPRKELFSAEELSLEWREMRKAVSSGGDSVDVEGLVCSL